MHNMTVPAPTRAAGAGPIRLGSGATPAGLYAGLPAGCNTALGSYGAVPGGGGRLSR